MQIQILCPSNDLILVYIGTTCHVKTFSNDLILACIIYIYIYTLCMNRYIDEKRPDFFDTTSSNHVFTVSSIRHSKFPLERASQTESPLHTLGEFSFRLKESLGPFDSTVGMFLPNAGSMVWIIGFLPTEII